MGVFCSTQGELGTMLTDKSKTEEVIKTFPQDSGRISRYSLSICPAIITKHFIGVFKDQREQLKVYCYGLHTLQQQ